MRLETPTSKCEESANSRVATYSLLPLWLPTCCLRLKHLSYTRDLMEETSTGVHWGNVPEVAVPEVAEPAADSFGSIRVLGRWFPTFPNAATL